MPCLKSITVCQVLFIYSQLLFLFSTAQRGIPASGTLTSNEENPAITGLLDGSGEYTLVYQDNEGDRMLVGDVPWE